MKKIFVLLSVFLFSCISTIEEKGVENNSNSNNYSTYGNLSIYGSLTIPGPFFLDDDRYNGTYGKLNLSELEMSLLSECMEDMVEKQDGMVGDTKCFVSHNDTDGLKYTSYIHNISS